MHTPTELSTASRRNAKPCCDATGVLAQGGLHLHACVYRSRYWNSHKQTAAACASMCVRSAHMLLALKRHTARLRPPWWVSRACIYRYVLCILHGTVAHWLAPSASAAVLRAQHHATLHTRNKHRVHLARCHITHQHTCSFGRRYKLFHHLHMGQSHEGSSSRTLQLAAACLIMRFTCIICLITGR